MFRQNGPLLTGAVTPAGDMAPLELDGSGNLKVTGGGGGGGAVTIADGGDVAEGTTTDPAWTSGAGTVIALLKTIAGAGASSSVDLIQVGGAAIALGQTTMAASLPVVMASNQTAVPISAAALPLPTLAATSTLQTSGGQKTQVVDGSGNVIGATSNALDINIKSGNPTSITANAGTNLNTSALALEAGNLATLVAALAIPTTIYNGKKAVTTAGTRVTLASSQAVKSVTVKALAANTGTIYVGDGSVASTTGFALAAGESISLNLTNLATVNLDCSVSGEGVTYLGVN